MCQPTQININLDQLRNIVGLGVRRASSFMALGLRVSNDQSVTSVALETNFRVGFMPENLAIEQIREVQQNFGLWTIGNGLREVDQTTSIFADRLFEICTLVSYNGVPVAQAAIDQIHRFFNKTNVSEKLKEMAESHGIDSDMRRHMPGLSKARNALSHNLSIVGPRHLTDENELHLSWMGTAFKAGDRKIAEAFEPFRVEASRIEFSFPMRVRAIPLGSAIQLSAQDLSEICLTYWVQAEKLTMALNQKLIELGIVRPDANAPGSE